MVVMGTGAMPDVMLARAAGLELGETGGVALLGDLETSARGVWAAGDMCEYDSVLHGGRVRIEHHEVARAQGRAAAAAMLGTRRPYAELPYFWTDLSDWATAEWVGITEAPEREIVRGCARRRRVQRAAPGGRPAGRGAVGRARRRPRARAAADRRRDRPLRPRGRARRAATSTRSESGRGRRVARAGVVLRLEHEDLDAEPVGGVDLGHERVHAPAGQALDRGAERALEAGLERSCARRGRCPRGRRRSACARRRSGRRAARRRRGCPRRRSSPASRPCRSARRGSARSPARSRSASPRRSARAPARAVGLHVGRAPRCRASVIGRHECRRCCPWQHGRHSSRSGALEAHGAAQRGVARLRRRRRAGSTRRRRAARARRAPSAGRARS